MQSKAVESMAGWIEARKLVRARGMTRVHGRQAIQLSLSCFFLGTAMMMRLGCRYDDMSHTGGQEDGERRGL